MMAFKYDAPDREPKLFFIDLMKVVGIILILNSHLDAVYPIPALATGGALGNSLFFITSGYLFAGRERSLKWIGKQLLKIYFSAEIALLFFCRGDINNFFLGYIWPTYYWFIGAIVLFYVLFFLLNKIHVLRHYRTFMLLGVVLYFSCYLCLLDTSVWVVEADGLTSIEGCFKLIYYFMIMVTGGYFRITKVPDCPDRFMPVLCVLSVVLLYFTKCMFHVIPGFIRWQFLNQLFVFSFSVSLLLILKKKHVTGNRPENGIGLLIKRTARAVSGYSLEIYLVQFEMISLAQKYNVIFPANLLLLLAMTAATSFLLNWCRKWILDTIQGLGERVF